MTVVHLATDTGLLCWARPERPSTTSDAESVTCLNCQRQLARQEFERADAEADQRLADRNRAAAEAVGITHVLDFLEADDAPTSSMLAGIIGTVAVYLQETGYTKLPARTLAADPGAVAAA